MSNLYLHYCHLTSLDEQEQNRYLAQFENDKETFNALTRMLKNVEHGMTQLFNDSMVIASDGLPNNLNPGDEVSKYRIVKLLGCGGMGNVYLGQRHDGEYTQDVAIKIVPLAFLGNKSDQIFNYEAQALASLTHINIVSVLDAGRDERGFAYIIMQYINGLSLKEYLKSQTLTQIQKLNIFIQVLEGIIHAHAHQILHRDIKPDNILVGRDGCVHIIDFGISKFIESRDSESLKSYFNALSYAYASPEQKAGKDITIASDIYSLGRVLEELIDSDCKVLKMIVSKATQNDITSRYATVVEFKFDIENFLLKKPIKAFDNNFYNFNLWFKRHSLLIFLTFFVVSAFSMVGAKYYKSYIYSQQQELLADNNLKLAENMLNQVDVKVVSEIERQRALVNSAKAINISLLPIEQGVRFTLSLANAYKTIGDYQECQLYTNKLLELIGGDNKFVVESVIAKKMLIELNVLNNNGSNVVDQVKSLNDQVFNLPILSDNRLFMLLDWEIGTTTISNVEVQRLFKFIAPNLTPLNKSQEILLKHIKLISSSNVSQSEQLVGINSLLDDIEGNVSEVSSKIWVNLIHDWYILSTTQGQHSVKTITERLINNAELLKSLFDSNHPSVYVLAILSKQTSVINNFPLPSEINKIYLNINPEDLPPLYRVNYFIIELSAAIKNKDLVAAYKIMSRVYSELPNYGENALNYYLQFTLFANEFGKQDLYLSHLEKIVEHYKLKGNLGHAAYFNYAICSNSSNVSSASSYDMQHAIDACEQAMAFYKQYHGESSNYYIMALLSKIQHFTNSNNVNVIKPFLDEALLLKKHISYPLADEKYYISMINAYLKLKDFESAKKLLLEFNASNNPHQFDKLLLNIKFLSETNNSEELSTAIASLNDVDCSLLSSANVESLTLYRRKFNIDPIEVCVEKAKWGDIVKDPKLAESIYSSVDQFVGAL